MLLDSGLAESLIRSLLLLTKVTLKHRICSFSGIKCSRSCTTIYTVEKGDKNERMQDLDRAIPELQGTGMTSFSLLDVTCRFITGLKHRHFVWDMECTKRLR